MADVVSIIRNSKSITFENLVSALDACESGDVVKLISDYTCEQEAYLDGKSIKLDLNGHSYSTNKTCVVVLHGGQLIIEDSSANKSGQFISTKSTGIFLGLDNDCEHRNSLILNSGNLKSQEFTVCLLGNAQATINGGTLSATDNSAIGGNGGKKFVDKFYNITINGGTLEAGTTSNGYANCCVYHSNHGLVSINGGVIRSLMGAGVVVRSGDLVVDGGTIEALGTSTGLMTGDSRPTVCGGIEVCNATNYPGKMGSVKVFAGQITSASNSAVVVIGDPSKYDNSVNSSIKLSGGSFVGADKAISYIDKDCNDISSIRSAKITVSGGTYNSDISDLLDSTVKVDVIHNADGSITTSVIDLSYIQKTSLDKLISNARLTGEMFAVWQHPMTEALADYCKENGWTFSPFISINPPARLGDQWLIHFGK